VTQIISRLGVAGMLDWQQAVWIAIHIGRALDFAHKQRIIHRNTVPSNILVQNSDKLAKLGDLMLAKVLEGSMAQPITRPGELVGDVDYMSPERMRGGSEVDGRSDIYSLGATVYALLTGRPPSREVRWSKLSPKSDR
jgi:serine/threonine-protein kinase